MFRNDIQSGGTAMGTNLGAPGMADLQTMGAGLVGGQGVAGIEKTMKWKLFFFAGACIVLTSGVWATLYWMLHFAWAPANFLSEIFLCVFGILLIVLDFPIPNPTQQDWPLLVATREHCYKFLLFMTRFMGRGLMYLFTGTLVFSALWDTNISWFFGAVFSMYLVLLGIAALVKGWTISNTLDKARLRLLEERDRGGNIEHQFFPPSTTYLTKSQFRTLLRDTIGEDPFSEDDLDYVMNALSFLPANDGKVSRQEFDYWVRPGKQLMV